MADSKLTWIFELYDKVSNPADNMSKSVGAAEKAMIASAAAMAKTAEMMELGHQAATRATESHGGFFEKLRHGLEILYFGKEVIGSFVEKVREMGSEALGSMAFRHNSLIALQALTGTKDKAVEVFEAADDFAWRTGQNIAEVMNNTKNMLSAGYSSGQIKVLQEMVADLRIIGPEGAAQSVVETLSNMGRFGQFTSRHILALNNAGISADVIYQKLGETFGKSRKGMQAFLQEGAIPSQYALKAIIDSFKAVAHTDAVGSFAKQASKTLPALVTRLKDLPEQMIQALTGLNGGNGDGPLEHILSNILDALDPAGESGQRILSRIRGLVDAVGQAFGISGGSGGLFAELAGPNGAQKVEEIFTKIVAGVEKALPVLAEAAHVTWTIVETIAKASRLFSGNLGGAAITEMGAMTPERRIELAQGTMTDGNSSYLAREYAKQELWRFNRPTEEMRATKDAADGKAKEVLQFSPVVNIHGVDTSSSETVRRGVLDGLADAFDQYAIQGGG